MRFGWAYALAATALITLLVPSAHADGTRATTGPRHDLRQTAPKECTRLNGRVGYYGNPWCSPAEQRAWDLWQDRRRDLSAGN